MTGMAGDSCFNSRQGSSPLLNSVRDKSFDSFRVFWIERQHLVELAFRPLGLIDTQVAFPDLRPHYLTASSDFEALLCPFVSF